MCAVSCGDGVCVCVCVCMNCSFCGTCTGSDPFFYFADPVQKVSLSCSNLSKSVGKFPCYVAEGGVFLYAGKQML